MSTLEGDLKLKILEAAHQAAKWHASQRRKGAAKEPYLNHLIEVAALVSAAGASEDVICAALLHDAIEDPKIPAETIASLFGEAVAEMVLEVTDDKKSLRRKSAKPSRSPMPLT